MWGASSSLWFPQSRHLAAGVSLPGQWALEVPPEEYGRAWPGLLPVLQQSRVEVAQPHLGRRQTARLGRGRDTGSWPGAELHQTVHPELSLSEG